AGRARREADSLRRSVRQGLGGARDAPTACNRRCRLVAPRVWRGCGAGEKSDAWRAPGNRRCGLTAAGAARRSRAGAQTECRQPRSPAWSPDDRHSPSPTPLSSPRTGAVGGARPPGNGPLSSPRLCQLAQRAPEATHRLADPVLVLDEGEADVAVAARAEADA